jgi:selenocysteine lyase/cysteine desulfurase
VEYRAAGWREEFYEFDDVAYLDVSTQGPLPRAAVRALEAAVEWKKFPHRMPGATYIELPARVRALLARLVGATPDEIGITTGASTGLAAIASAIDWKPGDEVLVARGEFPMQFCTWAPLEAEGKLKLKVIAPRGRFITAEDFLAHAGPRTRLVSVSLVRFDDASLLDAARLAKGLAPLGARLLLDVSQCAGAAPIDFRSLGADFGVCAGYKWLLGPYGTGFVWARRELLPELRPGHFYWMGVEGAEDFHALNFGPNASGKYDWRPPSTARRWDAAETGSFIHLAAVEASLEFLLRAGVETVRGHNAALLEPLVERLPRDRCVLVSPREASARGPYLCLAARTAEKTKELYQRLREQNICVALRQDAIRVAPHLYNTPEDVERVLRVLAA